MCIDGCNITPTLLLSLFISSRVGKKHSSKATERYFSANRVENSSSFGQAEAASWVSLGLSGRLLFTELTLSGHAGQPTSAMALVSVLALAHSHTAKVAGTANVFPRPPLCQRVLGTHSCLAPTTLLQGGLITGGKWRLGGVR